MPGEKPATGPGKKLRAARKAAGLSQAEVARRIGKAQGTVSLAEQGGADHDAEFKKQFEEVIELLTLAGGEMISEAEQALTFLKKLNQFRHGDMFVELQNRNRLGILYPDTLQKAYHLASNWKSKIRSGNEMVSFLF